MDAASLYDKIETWLVVAGPRILFALVIFVAGQWCIRLLKKWVSRALERKRFASNLRPFIQSFVFTAMQVLLVVGMMNILGIQMSIFAALVGGIGVAAGLALSGTLQNFTSGILILILKPYRTGDNIVAQGQEGTVTSIQLFYTVMTTYDNKTIIIPNSKLSNELIINITQSGFRRLDTTINLPFQVGFEEVKKLVEQTIAHYGRSSPKPPARTGVSEVRGDGYTASIQVWLPSHGFQDETLAFRELLLAAMTGSGWNLPGIAPIHQSSKNNSMSNQQKTDPEKNRENVLPPQGPQGVDKAPGEDAPGKPGSDFSVAQKGKKTDADPQQEKDRPARE